MAKQDLRLRLEILDKLLKSGDFISFNDYIDQLDPILGRINDPFYSSSLDRAYGLIFRQDIKRIRDIIKSNPFLIEQDMLITTGSNRTKKYKYKETSFSIIPYLEYQYTKTDYQNLNNALSILKNNIPQDVFENVEFALRSRIEYDYGHEEKNIDYDENYRLRGRDRLPMLYKCINKTVLSITYKTFDNQVEAYIIHPYLLKIYNNRWFLFGYRPDKSNNYWNVPLDRIENVVPRPDLGIQTRPKGYIHYFDDIIGVTKGRFQKGGSIDNKATAVTIKIGINNENTWKRIITKPIHKSQNIVQDFENGYGVVELYIIPNTEFYYRLLSIGIGISILEPVDVSEIMYFIINNMTNQ